MSLVQKTKCVWGGPSTVTPSHLPRLWAPISNRHRRILLSGSGNKGRQENTTWSISIRSKRNGDKYIRNNSDHGESRTTSEIHLGFYHRRYRKLHNWLRFPGQLPANGGHPQQASNRPNHRISSASPTPTTWTHLDSHGTQHCKNCSPNIDQYSMPETRKP